MLREAHYFVIVLMFILLVTTLLTFFISFSILPPEEDNIPRRSRPVFNESYVGEKEYGSHINLQVEENKG